MSEIRNASTYTILHRCGIERDEVERANKRVLALLISLDDSADFH